MFLGFFLLLTYGLNPAKAAECDSIAYGDFLNKEISAVGETDCYYFDGKAADVITIRATKQGGTLWPQLELFDPGGNSIALDYDTCRAWIDATLPSNGTYTILVSDDISFGTGPYGLALERVSNPFGPRIDYGGYVEDQINPIGEIDLYIFEACAEDVVTVVVTKQGGNLWPELELFDPSGNKIASDYDITQARIDKTLSVAGSYSIIVSGDCGTTGAYRLELERVASGTCPPLAQPKIYLTLTGCTSCFPGDTFGVTAKVINPKTQGVRVEVKAGIRCPDGTPKNLSILGNKHFEITLPPESEREVELLKGTVPTELSPGSYTYESSLLEPELGTEISRDARAFTISQ